MAWVPMWIFASAQGTSVPFIQIFPDCGMAILLGLLEGVSLARDRGLLSLDDVSRILRRGSSTVNAGKREVAAPARFSECDPDPRGPRRGDGTLGADASKGESGR